MCMQDIRIGRKSQYREGKITTAADAIGTIPGRGGRTRLWFSVSTGTTLKISSDRNAVAAQGFQLPNRSVGMTVMRVEDFGPWLEGTLYITGVGAGVQVRFLEVWLDGENP